MYGRDIDWRAKVTGLDNDPQAAALLDAAMVVKLDAQQTVFDKGSPCRAFLIVIDGSIRVQLLGESGRLVSLYRVRSGQSWVLTTTCLLGDQNCPAIGLTESPVRALQMSKKTFQVALGHSAGFGGFVVAGLGTRLACRHAIPNLRRSP